MHLPINTIDIVVSHYNEDIEWLKNLNTECNIKVYSKILQSEDSINYQIVRQPFNIGNEASSYLQYIVDNYDRIPNIVYFCHGHNSSFHQDYDNQFIIKNIDIHKVNGFLNINNYYNIIDNNKTETLLKNQGLNDNKPYRILIDVFDEFFSKYKTLPDEMSAYSSAQFFVTRDLIKSNTKEFYQECLDWFYSGYSLRLDQKYNEQPNVYSSRAFEWMWFFIFTNEKREKIINLTDFFKNE